MKIKKVLMKRGMGEIEADAYIQEMEDRLNQCLDGELTDQICSELSEEVMTDFMEALG